MATENRDTVFQRIGRETRRRPHVLIPLYFAIAALAIYAFGIFVLNWGSFNAQPSQGGPVAYPTPTSTPRPTPRPAPTPTRVVPTPIPTGLPATVAPTETATPPATPSPTGEPPCEGAGCDRSPTPGGVTPTPGAAAPSPSPTATGVSPGPTASPRPNATSTPRPTPTSTPGPGRIRDFGSPISGTFTNGSVVTRLTFTRIYGQCEIKSEIQEPSGQGVQVYSTRYIDNGCDLRLDSVWYRDMAPVTQRTRDNESRFKEWDQQYKDGLIALDLWEPE